MQAQSIAAFGEHHYLDEAGVKEVVSAPMPMVGNTVKIVADIYNMSGTLTITLEGSVLGQFWEDIPLSTAFNPGNWGASTSVDATVSHSLVRVRATLSGGGSAKAWFQLGLSFTDQ